MAVSEKALAYLKKQQQEDMFTKERSFFLPFNFNHPAPVEGFEFARTVQCWGMPFLSSHDTVSKSGKAEVEEWITKLGYTEYSITDIEYCLGSGIGYATINMK